MGGTIQRYICKRGGAIRFFTSLDAITFLRREGLVFLQKGGTILITNFRYVDIRTHLHKSHF